MLTVVEQFRWLYCPALRHCQFNFRFDWLQIAADLHTYGALCARLPNRFVAVSVDRSDRLV